MSTPDIKTNEYFEELRKKFSLNPNDDRSKLFKLYYGKVYENLPSHHNPIQINNILFTKRYKEIYNMSYINQSENEKFISDSNSFISEEFIKSNFPLYFLSKDFVENAMDADIDKNVLFEDISLPFRSVYYTLPNNMFLDWFSLTYIPEKDDILLYVSQSQQNSQNILFLRNFLTSPEVNEKHIDKFNPIISFAIATLLFHKTGGFNQKIIPITPLPLIKNRMGKIVIGERKKVSPNILSSPKISYRKKSDSENLNEPVEFEGYKQIPSHIRIIKDKKTGEIKIISVSSSEVNPDKRREGVEFQKNKMTDNEIAQLIKARKEDIVSRMKSRGFSEDEINQFLKQKNLNESFEIYSSFKTYFYLKESKLTNNSKSFYLALKSRLSNANEFVYNFHSGTKSQSSVTFTYKGTRRIMIKYSLWFYGAENRENNNVENISVFIFRTNFNNQIIETLDKNYNLRTNTFNPSITNEIEFVEYIQSVLDRDS